MGNIALLIQYEGSRYQGWQRQREGDRTIQAKLEGVLSRMVGTEVGVIGASRTDAGVHAQGQVANFHAVASLSLTEILAYCYRYLPEDIVVRAAAEVDERFHARYLARAKRYVYRIYNRPRHDVFDRHTTYHVPERLDLDAMRSTAAALRGPHDFASFCASRTGHKSTERDLLRAEIEEADGLVEITFEAAAFLHGMVRIMAGTLIDAGLHRVEPREIPAILARAERRAAGFTAPAQGLRLEEVRYDQPLFGKPPAG